MKRLIALALINIFFVIVLSVSTPYFLTRANLVAIVDNMALEAIILSGYTLLLIGGWFDLSVDGVVGLTGVVAGLSMNRGVPWPLAILLSLLIGGCVGMINGIVVAKIKINGLIATFAAWWICVGFTLGMTKAVTPFGFPAGFQILGQARIFGFRVIVIYAIFAIALFSFILHMTQTGCWLCAAGDSPHACDMMGIDISKLGLKVYTALGLLAGFVGIVTASRLNAASSSAVDGMTLRIIAAAVIGGVKLSGGQGTVIGGLMGLIMMSILSNSIIQLGISPYWQKAILGAVLLVAVLTEQLNFSFKRRKADV